MRAVCEDRLIAGMDVGRPLPVHESCRRLRELDPHCPRVYGVAVLADVVPRAWWPMNEERTIDRVQMMFKSAAAETDSNVAGRQLAATLIHEIVGRMLPLVLLEGRAWDVGLENLWLHVDRDGAFDWAAIVDPTLRVLPDDPYLPGPSGGAVPRSRHDGVVVLPSEAALTTWVAHRCHVSLTPLFATLHSISAGAISVSAMWHIVGSVIIGIAAHLPLPQCSDDAIARRSQAILDALVGFGLPVRRRHPTGPQLPAVETDRN